MTRIGENIRRLRNGRGLTQKELGVLIGIPENTAQRRVGQWENGNRNPGADSLMKLAKALQCNVDTLLKEDDSMGERISFVDITKFFNKINQLPKADKARLRNASNGRMENGGTAMMLVLDRLPQGLSDEEMQMWFSLACFFCLDTGREVSSPAEVSGFPTSPLRIKKKEEKYAMIVARFDHLMQIDFSSLEWWSNLKGFIINLRNHDLDVNFPHLLRDLLACRDEEKRFDVIMNWNRSMYFGFDFNGEE